MAAEEKESSRSFRVEDRRRFASVADDLRSNESSNQAAEHSPPEEPRSSSSPQVDAQHSAPPPPRPEISFSSFILGLSTQALIYMGEIPSAPGQPPQTDLAAAQQMIDVLAMLKEKTAGNLDAGEEMMLESALFDLRMRYVELAKKGRDSSLSERRD